MKLGGFIFYPGRDNHRGFRTGYLVLAMEERQLGRGVPLGFPSGPLPGC